MEHLLLEVGLSVGLSVGLPVAFAGVASEEGVQQGVAHREGALRGVDLRAVDHRLLVAAVAVVVGQVACRRSVCPSQHPQSVLA